MLTIGEAHPPTPPSIFGVDAPELARLGRFAVGVRTVAFTQHAQLDVLAFDSRTGAAPKRDRILTVDLWYPASFPPGSPTETYQGTLPSELPTESASFLVPGIGVRNATPTGKDHPLIVVSHGYSNCTVAMTWLTENLASKGYVVAAIRHEDPPISDRSKFHEVLLRRPLDIAYVTESLQKSLAREHLIDASRTALVGYSMGGYGVLSAAGATLDPESPLTKMVPGGLMMPYVRGGSQSKSIVVKPLRAVVAISPAGGGNLAAWGPAGLREINAPLMLIAGNRDRTIDYVTGARSIFDAAENADRYLLTFKEGGHALGLNPVPESMRTRLWDQEWFEDPVWKKERISAINVHFITAFLDHYVMDDASRSAYLDVRTQDSDDGIWPASGSLSYEAYSPSDSNITVWKGFQRNRAAGLQMLHAAAARSAK